jgi:hypothetical protein
LITSRSSKQNTFERVRSSCFDNPLNRTYHHNIAVLDDLHTTDPFDDLSDFILSAALNPTWTGFSKEFFYETKYADRLDKKKLVIECYDKDFLSSDDFIGMA